MEALKTYFYSKGDWPEISVKACSTEELSQLEAMAIIPQDVQDFLKWAGAYSPFLGSVDLHYIRELNNLNQRDPLGRLRKIYKDQPIYESMIPENGLIIDCDQGASYSILTEDHNKNIIEWSESWEFFNWEEPFQQMSITYYDFIKQKIDLFIRSEEIERKKFPEFYQQKWDAVTKAFEILEAWGEGADVGLGNLKYIISLLQNDWRINPSRTLATIQRYLKLLNMNLPKDNLNVSELWKDLSDILNKR